MRGAGLRRYMPDPQSGGGFVKDTVREVLSEGFKKGYPHARQAIRSGYTAGRATATRAIKRKAQQAVTGKAKQVFRDIFG